MGTLRDVYKGMSKAGNAMIESVDFAGRSKAKEIRAQEEATRAEAKLASDVAARQKIIDETPTNESRESRDSVVSRGKKRGRGSTLLTDPSSVDLGGSVRRKSLLGD